jgi:transcriptional regulator with XRE-family HTH domain
LAQDVQKRVGDNIRHLRKEQGYTQDAFADRAGLHRAHMGEIERGESNVTIQTLKIIADALKMKIADLVKGV